MKSAMVLAGESRGTLTVTRALGQLGIPVYVGSSDFLSRSAFSKYCKKSFIYSSPYENDLEKAHKDILHHVKKFKPDVLFPGGAETSHIVFKYAAEYEKYCRVMANLGSKRFSDFEDKAFQTKTAKKFGYGIPKTYFPKNLDDVKRISKKISYPALIKPRISTAGIGIQEALHPAQLISEYEKMTTQKKSYRFDPKNPLIQELVEGQKFFLYGVFDRGRPIVGVLFHNFRIYPKWGNPLLIVSVRNDAVMQETMRFMKKMKWHGLFCLQGAIDVKDGRPKFFEISPRLGGLTGGVITSGVNIPHILFRMALGERVERRIGYSTNRKFRSMQFGELFYFLESKHKLSLLKEYLSFKNTKTDFELRDPLPNIIRFVDLVVNRAVL